LAGEETLLEAYLLMDKKGQKPSNIYLDLGFECLSYFLVAFKKMFRRPPAAIMVKKK